MSNDDPKEVYIKNTLRDAKQNLGAPEDFQPEYERLNRQPNPVDVKDDFRYAKKRPMVVVSGSTRHTFTENDEPRKVMVVSDETSSEIPKQPKNLGVVSGYSHERAWEPNREPIMDVDERAEYDKSMHRTLQTISEGTVAILVGDEMIECSSVEEAEGVVETLLFSDNNSINIHQISVIHKLKIKVGVSVK